MIEKDCNVKLYCLENTKLDHSTALFFISEGVSNYNTFIDIQFYLLLFNLIVLVSTLGYFSFEIKTN